MKRCCVTIGFLLILSLSLAGSAAAKPAGAPCGGCHRATVDKGKGKLYVHSPFLRGKCEVCHVAGEAVMPTSKREVREAELGLPEKIHWFRQIYDDADTHWVLLPRGSGADGLIYKARAGAQRMAPKNIAVPPLDKLPSKRDDGEPPRISEVEVADVRRGISTTATIRWTTDEFSGSKIAYGEEGLISSRQSDKLTRNHEILLQGLDRDRTYSFKVASTDLFGNSAESEQLSFTTDKTFLLPQARHEDSGGAGEAQVSWELFGHEGRYLAVFSADRPVSLSLGVPAEKDPSEVARRPRGAAVTTTHPVLKSPREITVDACKRCHGYLKEYISHPVNVRPKAGMVIPPEYPLLPDGRISCMSCHDAHGGNHEYRLIKSSKKELCTGCHQDY